MSILDTFSPEVITVLRAAGWSPRRRVPVEPWDCVLRVEGYVLSGLARELLRSLGGLRLQPLRSALYRDRILIEPVLAGSGARDIADEFEQRYGQRFYPIAEWIGGACVFVGDRGMVVSYDDFETLRVGLTPAAAFDVMIVGTQVPHIIRRHTPKNDRPHG